MPNSGRLTHDCPITFTENVGWIYQGAIEYQTPNWGDDPDLYLDVAYDITARIHN